MARVLEVAHKALHAMFKPDETAEGRAVAVARRDNPAADQNAQSIVIHSLHREGASDVEVEAAAAETLGQRTQAALYEMVREALEGSIRRGPPTIFSVKVRAVEGDLEVELYDDAPGERRRRSVEVLQERARTLGASLYVEPGDGGTRMKLMLPGHARGE